MNLGEKLRACPSPSNLNISGKVSDWPAGAMCSVVGVDVGPPDWEPFWNHRGSERAILFFFLSHSPEGNRTRSWADISDKVQLYLDKVQLLNTEHE